MSRRTHLKRLYCLLAIATVSLCISAEEIHLKDGTKLSGQITGVTSDKFQIKTAYGDVQVPRTDILSIDFPENQLKEEVAAKPHFDQAIEGNTYLNRSENLKVTVPKGWTVAPEFLSKDIHGGLKSQDETQFLFITPENFSGTLQTYSVVVETQLQTVFKNFEKLSQSETTVDGRPAMRLVFHGKSAANNTPLKFLIYMVSYEGRVVRLSFGTFEPLFDKASPDFEKMATSLKTSTVKN